jgi:serine/threonine protein kinase
MLSARESDVGRVIAGKYALESVIGDGSCGVVYRAKQLALGKDVAVKVLHRTMSLDPSIVERFHREARAASQLGHPSSVTVFDFGQEPDGLLYLVMEYVAGRDLLEVMNDEGPLEPRRIAMILGQVLAALAVAHDRAIIHRDLKPENILLVRAKSDDGEAIDVVKVCDFGIATVASSNDPNAMRLTARGLIVGTPEYMAPEQALGGAVDGRTDLYALGAVLYQLLTHRVPFRGSTPMATVLQQINAPVTPPSHYVPWIDPLLERICLRALAKSPDERFANAREMRAALREMQTQTQRCSEVPSFRPKRRWPLVAIVGVLSAIAIGTLAGRREGVAPASLIEQTAATATPKPAPTEHLVLTPPTPIVKNSPPIVKKKRPAPRASAAPAPTSQYVDDGF